MLREVLREDVAHAHPHWTSSFFPMAHVNTGPVCNIRCVFCPRQTWGNEIDSGFLTADYFEPVAPHFEAALRTGLYGLGEPFLNARFFDFLRAAKERGTFCMTSSHGMSLKPRIIERVLDEGLDELDVSFDGATRRTVNFLRKGADFDTIVENVSALIRRRNERGLSHPRVHISFTVSKYNVWEMARAVRLVHRMGADRIVFSNLVLDHPEHEHVSVVGSRVYHFNLARARKEAERLGVDMATFHQIPFPYKEQPARQVGNGMRHGCPEAWRAIIVEKDGNLKPCCYLNTSYGNTRTGDYTEQLNSDKAVAFRRTFTEGRYLNTCRGCGHFQGITDAETAEILDVAEARVRDGNFSPDTRILLEEKVRYFRALAQKAPGAG